VDPKRVPPVSMVHSARIWIMDVHGRSTNQY
jgi:hypothetical protein